MVVKTLELVVLCHRTGARGVAVGEEGEVGDEGGLGVRGAAGGVAGAAIGGGGVGGGGGGGGGGEEEGTDHGDAGGEVERQELAFVEELIGGTEGGGGFARRNGDGELEVGGRRGREGMGRRGRKRVRLWVFPCSLTHLSVLVLYMVDREEREREREWFCEQNFEREYKR